MSTSTTDVAIVAPMSASTQLDSLRSGAGVFTTIKGADQAAKVATLNAMTNSVALADNLGAVINLVDVVVHVVGVNQDDGSVSEAVRMILIDDEGKSYHAISGGIFSALQNIFGVLGMPDTWENPLPVTVSEEKGRSGRRFMTIKIA